MTRLVTFCSLALALSTIPTGLAGPACAHKNYRTTSCIERCKTRWGWTGSMMGIDRWGSVINKIGNSPDVWDSIISEACGSSVPSVPDATGSLSAPDMTTFTTPSGPVISASPNPAEPPSYTLVPVSPSVISTPSASLSSIISTVTPTSSPAPVAPPATTTPQTTVTPITTRFTTSVRPTSRPVTTETPTTSRAQPTVVTTNAPPPPPPSSDQSSSSTSSSDIQTYLSTHNSVRAAHGAAPLVWSDELASKAQQWANGCKFQHSGGTLGPFGENLAAGTGSSYGITQAVQSWTNEVSQYNPNNPVPSHFTQVVWKGSQQLGCAVQECDGIFSASFGKAKYYVCEYSPAGNVIGQFAENVQV